MIDIQVLNQEKINERLQKLSEALWFDKFLAQVAQQTFNEVDTLVGKHSKSGVLQRSLGSGADRVSERLYSIKSDGTIAPHNVFVHWGHRAFRLYPKDRKALRWVSGGKFRFAKWVDIPAYSGDPFMVNALNNVLRDFDNLVQAHMKLED